MGPQFDTKHVEREENLLRRLCLYLGRSRDRGEVALVEINLRAYVVNEHPSHGLVGSFSLDVAGSCCPTASQAFTANHSCERRNTQLRRFAFHGCSSPLVVIYRGARNSNAEGVHLTIRNRTPLGESTEGQCLGRLVCVRRLHASLPQKRHFSTITHPARAAATGDTMYPLNDDFKAANYDFCVIVMYPSKCLRNHCLAIGMRTCDT